MSDGRKRESSQNKKTLIGQEERPPFIKWQHDLLFWMMESNDALGISTNCQNYTDPTGNNVALSVVVGHIHLQRPRTQRRDHPPSSECLKPHATIAFCERQFQTPSPQQTEGSSPQSMRTTKAHHWLAKNKKNWSHNLEHQKRLAHEMFPLKKKIKWTAFTSGFSFVEWFLGETRIHLWIHDCFNHIKFMTVLLGHVVVWNFANASEGHRSWPGERPREPWSMRLPVPHDPCYQMLHLPS